MNARRCWQAGALALQICAFAAQAQPPASGTVPIRNGKLQTNLDFAGFKGTNGALPTATTDVATKAYVDSVSGTGIAPIAAFSILGNNTSSTAAVTALGASAIKTLLSLDLVENTALSIWPGSSAITTLGTISTGSFPTANLTGLIAGPQIAAGAVTYSRIQNVTTGKLLGRSTSGVGSVQEISVGTGLQLSSGGTLTSSGGTGGLGFSEQTLGRTGSTGTPSAWTDAVTTLRETQALDATYYTTLPSASSFPPGTIITYIDNLTTGNFGRVFRPKSANTINGGTADVAPFIGGGRLASGATQRWETDGTSNWVMLDVGYSATGFSDSLDVTKRIAVDISAIAPNTSFFFRPSPIADSVSVVPGLLTGGNIVKGVNSNGTLAPGTVRSTDILPNEFALGNATAVITNDGTIDSVKLSTLLTQTQTYTWPDAALYSSGERVTFYDTTGSLSAGVLAHVVGTNGNTFNGASTIDISQPYFNRTFVADPVNLNWSISNASTGTSGGLSKGSWSTVTPSGSTATIPVNSGAAQQFSVIPLSVASTALVISGAQNGDAGRIKFRQDATGSRVVTLPTGTKTPLNGLGTITLSTGANAEDEFQWDFDGTNYNFFQAGVNFTRATPPSFTTVADQGTQTSTSSSTANDTNATYYVAANFVACGQTGGTCLTTGTSYTVGKIEIGALKVAAPTYNVYAAIYTDNGAASPADRPAVQVGTASAAVAASSLATTESFIAFTGVNATLTAGTKYWVVYYSDAPSRSVSDMVTSYRTDANGVFNNTTTLTSTTAGFVAGDVGSVVTTSATGVTLAANTTIASVTNGTTVVLSAAATGSGTGTITIASKTITSATAAFASSTDVGSQVTGTNIPSNTVYSIASVTNGTTAVLSNPVTGAGTALPLTIGPGNNVNFTRWANSTTTGNTTAKKTNTGTWASLNTTKFLRWNLYK